MISDYFGSKGNLYRQIINLIPPHIIYIEPYLGAGWVFRKKKKAELNIISDCDPKVFNTWLGDRLVISVDGFDDYAIYDDDRATRLENGLAVDVVSRFMDDKTAFVYLDPPYLLSTRLSRNRYVYDMDEDDHVELLTLINQCDCMVAISGYPSDLYADMLHGWIRYDFDVRDRGGNERVECLWTNYPQPTLLHEYSYLGDTFRERERIKRKADRWVNGLNKLPLQERQAIVSKMRSSGLI